MKDLSNQPKNEYVKQLVEMIKDLDGFKECDFVLDQYTKIKEYINGR